MSTLRQEWEFEYTAGKLADAAKLKMESHTKRLEWWEAKKKEVMQKVRDSGIEIHDSVAASYSNTKGGYGPEIKIDIGMQRDLSECQSKILEHTALIKSYDGWVQVLEANKESRLKLSHEDWLFFFAA